jgi:2'-5' RNA ligase
MRLFVAIELPEGVKGTITKAQDSISNDLAETKYLTKEQMHLTLKFLGEVEEDKIQIIKEKLKQIKFQPFSFELDKIGVFPSENYIRVVWVGIKPEDKVINLQESIENSLKEFNFKKDFKFHPHITLGRVKFVKDKKAFIEKLKSTEVEKKKIEINEFKLIKSTLTEQGPVYEILESF